MMGSGYSSTFLSRDTLLRGVWVCIALKILLSPELTLTGNCSLEGVNSLTTDPDIAVG